MSVHFCTTNQAPIVSLSLLQGRHLDSSPSGSSVTHQLPTLLQHQLGGLNMPASAAAGIIVQNQFGQQAVVSENLNSEYSRRVQEKNKRCHFSRNWETLSSLVILE